MRVLRDPYPLSLAVAWCATSWHWLSGWNFVPWDSIDAFFPQIAFIVAALRQGEWPTWNPLAFGGLPVLGDPQGMIFTPHVLTGLLSGEAFGLWVFDTTTLACILAGTLCLYSYARAHDAAPGFAALGALVFLLGGYATSRLQHVPQIISFALLPVLLFAFRRTVREPSLGNVLALGATGALLALNPNHIVFLIPFLLGPLLLVELMSTRRPLTALPRLIMAAALVMLVAAPSLSAILETVSLSTRQELTLVDSTPASLPGFTALSIIMPGIFGIRGGGEFYWGPTDMTEAYLYIGVIPVAAILMGMGRREAPTIALAVTWLMGLLSFLFAMGTRGPLFPFLYENVPGFSLFRRPSDGAYFVMLYCSLAVALAGAKGNGRSRAWPERLLIPSIVALLLLACSIGIVNHAAEFGQTDELIMDLRAFATRAFIALVLALLLWLFLPHAQRAAAIPAALVALTAFDLASTGRFSTFTARYSDHGVAAMYRVLSRWQASDSGEAHSMRRLAAVQSRAWRVEVVGGAAVNAPMSLGLPMSQGYNPLVPQRYAEVFGAQHLGAQPKAFSVFAPSLDAEAYRWLGLRFLLLHNYILDHPEEFGEIGRRIVALRDDALQVGGSEIETEGTYLLLELPHAYPRAGIVPDASDAVGGPMHQCEILSERTTQAEYRCEAPVRSKLIIGDSFAPGWRACVNGEETAIAPFLHALRSIQIPEGVSVVKLRYQPVPFLRRFGECAR